MGISENADSPLLCSREIKLMQYPKDDIQKEILKAAEKVFLENGFPKASMREIAQEAQVGLSNIYNYFKSKDDIFLYGGTACNQCIRKDAAKTYIPSWHWQYQSMKPE